MVGIASGNTVIYGFALIQETGKIAILSQFSPSDGYPESYSHIVYAPDGNIYGIGTAGYNGSGQGFVYRFTPSGSYSRFYTFSKFPTLDGNYGYPLIAASDGNLYGTFPSNTTNSRGGVLYQLTLSGQFHILANFPSSDVWGPMTLMQAADGNLYGSTVTNTIFRYDMASQQLSTAFQLDRLGAQGRCGCRLVEGMDGLLYGIAGYGGNSPGDGAVFSIDFGWPKPLPVVSGLYPSSGPVGQKVILWGRYLLGVKSVTFNGTPATAPISTSVQSILVTVPNGATSGPLTVTTGNGSFTTTQNFTVQ